MNTPRALASAWHVDSGADDHICHPDFAKESPLKKCEVDTERCAKQPIISPWDPTRQSESGNTGTEGTLISRLQTYLTIYSSCEKLLKNGFVSSLKETDSIMCHQSRFLQRQTQLTWERKILPVARLNAFG